MPKLINTEQFFTKAADYPVLDIRSPAEYEKGHIPGAINFPLLSNEERKQVGTTYKQIGKNEAVLQGLDIIGPKMSFFAKEALELAKDNQLILYCWRGGMRSNSMAWLLEKVGIKVFVLKNGYKAYRHFCKQQLSQSVDIIIVSGSTGSGKTHILKALHNAGEQIIDLEGIANHKGSVFGAMGQLKQLSNEQFENQLYLEWSRLDRTRTIWLEDESNAIGCNYIPKELFVQMRCAPVVRVIIDDEVRVERLLHEYAVFDKTLLIDNINKIKKRLSPEKAKEAIDAVNRDNLAISIRIVLGYYDKAYNFGLGKRNPATITEINLGRLSIEKCARNLILNKEKIKGE
ncbi:MAG: tRNA 2-selenouridine(34) synthase MnmH [Gammaproteobacteria bacterium]|nr:MAG: tRNA 2-selenouridine(34) synthase MnmH [Gammaproteobacteria bacterium]